MNTGRSGSVRAAENDRKINRFRAATGRALSGTWRPSKWRKKFRWPLNGDQDHKTSSIYGWVQSNIGEELSAKTKRIRKIVKWIKAVERVQMVGRYYAGWRKGQKKIRGRLEGSKLQWKCHTWCIAWEQEQVIDKFGLHHWHSSLLPTFVISLKVLWCILLLLFAVFLSQKPPVSAVMEWK